MGRLTIRSENKNQPSTREPVEEEIDNLPNKALKRDAAKYLG